jgi:hypothetical protein
LDQTVSLPLLVSSGVGGRGRPFFSCCTHSRLCACGDHVWFEDRWMVASLCDE